MISSKLFAVVVTASTWWVVDAGKCKPHPNPTSFLTLTSGDLPATSYPVSYFTSSGDDAHVFSSTDPLSSSRLTETGSSGISESSAMPSYQIPTSSPTASDSTTASVSTASSDNVIIEAPTFSSSFTTVVSVDVTTLGDSSTTTDTITTSINELSSTEVSSSTKVSSSTGVSSLTSISSSTEVSTSTDVSTSTEVSSTDVSTSTDAAISTHSTTSFETTISSDLATSAEQTTTTDTAIPTQPTSAEASDITETTVTTFITALTDVTTTASTTVFTSETTTTTENLWTSTTAASCPVYSSSLNDPSFEGDNTGPDRWDYMGQFAGVAVPFQKENSMSEKVPRAYSGNQFALLSAGLGSKLGSDMWRPMSLDPTKKYRVWFTFAAVSDPDEDWYFNFIIATRMYGHASRETINVPKGSPFVYRQQSTIIQGAQGDNLYAFMRVNAGSNPRLVAVDDIYVADHPPSAPKHIERYF
ncbi:uncharacterized protein FIESC28_07019 [Fusarium coffeatum]|uniref:CBM-cenC domain-containing protein n=1 Tax=Fusarium coffeatum TaxID=231269 RepID=A0A366RGL5_9HYPO|nr:uncharacterized protein FIESC28_07019 [Fusarium coffeatum]RBR16269.1 hypothetical protein FIESC28_07019 [Fusarium coffeatum]